MIPVLLTERVVLLCGDSRELDLGEGVVDSVVTDPPYELAFMGKGWDASGVAYDVGLWRRVLRALKPGGHLEAFGATRTYHRLGCAVEDAGFQIRDSMQWVYGTGFPKSRDLGRDIDLKRCTLPGRHCDKTLPRKRREGDHLCPQHPDGDPWRGYGTALKPAQEPIVLARKPFKGTVYRTFQQHGTAVLNIDGCRIGTSDSWAPSTRQASESIGTFKTNERTTEQHEDGRWPANFLLAHLPECRSLGVREVERTVYQNVDEEYERDGTVYDGGWRKQRAGEPVKVLEEEFECAADCPVAELGEPAGFFYCAKPSDKERDYGCDDMPVRSGGQLTDRVDGSAGLSSPRAGAGRRGNRRNVHPTVKPIDLMRYLCRLVTPPGGVVLDPFTGSGTTGIAAVREGFSFIGVEQSPEYAEIAKARILRALSDTEKRKYK